MLTSPKLRTVIRIAEISYGSLVLFVLTVGPVVRLWSAAQAYVPVDSAQLTTYVVLQLPALILSTCRAQRLKVNLTLLLLVTLSVWAILTAALSPHAAFASGNALKTLLATCTGLYLATSFSTRERLLIVFFSMQFGVMISWFAVARLWTNSRLENGQWNGIMINPNYLGPISLVSGLSLCWLVVLCWNLFPTLGKIVSIIVLILTLLLNGAVIWNTSPVNALVAITISLVAVLVVPITRAFKSARPRDSDYRLIPRLGLAIAAGVSLLVYCFNDLINGPLLPVNVLQSRIYAWSYAWHGALERPWLGWGQGVAWNNSQFRKMDGYWTVELLAHSHSAFYETLLSFGFPGVLLLIGYLAVGCTQQSLVSYRERLSSYSIVFFCIFVSIFEPFLATNFFTWSLVVAFITGLTTHNITNSSNTTSSNQ